MSSDLQRDALRFYTTLTYKQETWGGKLFCVCNEGCDLSYTPAVISIAGGASLVLHANAPALKSAMRGGRIDFVVNTLDEALRTLKNEIRQKRPLSVGVIADVQAARKEMDERGVSPDFLLTIRASPDLVEVPAMADERFFPAATPSDMREIDANLLNVIPIEDVRRRRWIQLAPQYLREARTGGRWISLNAEEREAVKIISSE